MSSNYDFGALYGMADHSVGRLLENGSYDAIVEDGEWGKTKAGDKDAWTWKFRVTTGEYANSPLTMTMAVSPVKDNGEPNEAGLGIMFRQLGSMGIPVPPDQQPWWLLGWTPENVAQAAKGRPVQIAVIKNEWDGGTNNKVKDIRPPRPGAPLQVQQPPQQFQQQPQQGYSQGYGQPQQPPMGGPGGGYQMPPNGYQQQPPQQPGYGYAGQQQAAPPPPQQGQAPGPWQGAQPPAAGQPQQIPGAPAWAQPPQPGQGGMGEFTNQGQSQQGYQGQQPPNGYQQGPPPQGYGAPAQGAPAPGAQYQQGAPSPSDAPPQQPQRPPWAQ
jgi:hypothetical protein